MKMFPIMLHSDRDTTRLGSIGLARKRGTPYVCVCVPWEMLAPHEAQAQRNHSQSLQRLAERGGLSAGECLAVLEGKGWHNIEHDGARANEQLCRKVAEWIDAELAASPEQSEASAHGQSIREWEA